MGSNSNASHAGAAATGSAAEGTTAAAAAAGESADGMPTDRLLDVTPQALRMSSPFNAAYWLSAA